MVTVEKIECRRQENVDRNLDGVQGGDASAFPLSGTGSDNGVTSPGLGRSGVGLPLELPSRAGSRSAKMAGGEAAKDDRKGSAGVCH